MDVFYSSRRQQLQCPFCITFAMDMWVDISNHCLLFVVGKALIWVSTFLLCDLKVHLDWSEPIMLIHLWFRKGLDSTPGQRDARAKSARVFWEGFPHSAKGTCWANSLSFFCCFLLLCLDVAVSRCDAWNCISHPVTWEIAVLRTNLTHGGLQSRKRVRVWDSDDIVGQLS